MTWAFAGTTNGTAKQASENRFTIAMNNSAIPIVITSGCAGVPASAGGFMIAMLDTFVGTDGATHHSRYLVRPRPVGFLMLGLAWIIGQ